MFSTLELRLVGFVDSNVGDVHRHSEFQERVINVPALPPRLHPTTSFIPSHFQVSNKLPYSSQKQMPDNPGHALFPAIVYTFKLTNPRPTFPALLPLSDTAPIIEPDCFPASCLCSSCFLLTDSETSQPGFP